MTINDLLYIYIPRCSMYGIIWNIYLHLPQKSTSFVGKYSTHGASGI